MIDHFEICYRMKCKLFGIFFLSLVIWESERMLRIKSVVLEVLTKLTTTVSLCLASFLFG